MSAKRPPSDTADNQIMPKPIESLQKLAARAARNYLSDTFHAIPEEGEDAVREERMELQRQLNDLEARKKARIDERTAEYTQMEAIALDQMGEIDERTRKRSKFRCHSLPLTLRGSIVASLNWIENNGTGHLIGAMFIAGFAKGNSVTRTLGITTLSADRKPLCGVDSNLPTKTILMKELLVLRDTAVSSFKANPEWTITVATPMKTSAILFVARIVVQSVDFVGVVQ